VRRSEKNRNTSGCRSAFSKLFSEREEVAQDFDNLSLSDIDDPLWIHKVRDRVAPVAAHDCGDLVLVWGPSDPSRHRDVERAFLTGPGHRRALDVASGTPGPQGDSQSSPGVAVSRAQSQRIALEPSTSIRARRAQIREVFARTCRIPQTSRLHTSRRRSRGIRHSSSRSSQIRQSMPGHAASPVAHDPDARIASFAQSSFIDAINTLRVSAPIGSPFSAARLMNLVSMSVMLRTSVTT